MENPPEPIIELNLNGEKFEATRDNTTLFQFFGRLAIYNHIFLEMGEDEKAPFGAYIFSDHPTYPDLEELIVAHEFPQHLALREVGQCDVDAWERHTFDDVRSADTFPAEWLNGTTGA